MTSLLAHKPLRALLAPIALFAFFAACLILPLDAGAAPPPAPPPPAPATAPTAPAPAPKKYGLVDPLNSGGGNIQLLIGRATRIITGISGSIGLLMFVYGGFVWITSGGNPEKIKKGKQIFVMAVVGLFIIFASYAILRVLFRALASYNDVTG